MTQMAVCAALVEGSRKKSQVLWENQFEKQKLYRTMKLTFLCLLLLILLALQISVYFVLSY